MKTLTTPIQERETATLASLVAMLAAAREGGLTNIPTLQALLFIAAQEGSTTAGAITEEVGVSTARMTGLLDTLEEVLGFIEREHNRKDRRKWHVRITAKGRAFLTSLAAA